MKKLLCALCLLVGSLQAKEFKLDTSQTDLPKNLTYHYDDETNSVYTFTDTHIHCDSRTLVMKTETYSDPLEVLQGLKVEVDGQIVTPEYTFMGSVKKDDGIYYYYTPADNKTICCKE